jgi:formylglycine-generating enzyme required for sulfatase activity
LGQWQISELQVIIDQFVDQFVDSRCRRCRVIPVLLPRVEKIPDSLLFLQSLNWVRFENIDDGLALGKLAKGITGIIDFTENLGTGITLEMVAIPEGNFMMGAPKNEKDSYDDERPQHEVSVPTFLMGKYQITQAQWKAVAGLPQIEKELNPDPSRLKGDNRPVGRVSWLEAVEFCKRLSEHTKREYRLPSEAEWEYACRAGTTTAYYFGNDVAELENYAWYNKNSEGETHPVGEKLPNGFGLHDMHGNVWEWCADDWHDSYKNAPSDGRAWIDNDNRSQSEDGRKLLRGGSSITFARNCRSACRYDLEARPQDDYFGFRVVCVLQ